MVINVRISKKDRGMAFIICILMSVLTLVKGIGFNADAEGSGSARLVCRYNDEILADMKWNIYYAGSLNDDKFVLGGAFSEYRITHGDLSAETLTKAASTLENYAVLHNITPDASGTTDADGVIRFDNLNAGFYLVSGSKLKIENGTYTPAPMLIEISESAIDIDVYPKFSYYDVLDAEIERFRVRKIWENDEQFPTDRAEEINVDIYCNSVLKETVTLSEKNDWTYNWTAQPGDTWRVLESDIPANYTVAYRSNNSQYVIINTHDSSVITTTTAPVTTSGSKITSTTAKATSTTTGKTGGKLPQTGQLWWPVPVLALGGMIFVGIGFCLISRSKKEDD